MYERLYIPPGDFSGSRSPLYYVTILRTLFAGNNAPKIRARCHRRG